MGRLHGFEFEDQPWCPRVLREGVTAYLRLVVRLTGQARLAVPRLAELLEASGETRILDLCSGGGGPLPEIVAGLRERGLRPAVMLTDRYPDAEALRALAARGPGSLAFSLEPVDATAVPPRLPGLRTLFNALHHFRPDEARQILAGAARCGQPIAIFEFVDRSLLSLLGVLASPLLALLLVPWIRPLRGSRLLFTWLIPLIPLMALWDGLVSWLRLYSLEELRALVAGVDVPGYGFEVGRVPGARLPLGATFVIGRRR